MRISGGGLRALLGATAVAASGCAPAMSGASVAPVPDAVAQDARIASMLDVVATSAEALPGRAPQVWLRTEATFAGANRVDVTFGVTEDAYVLVGMVGRDGELHILHPVQSTASHLVSASRVQRLDNVFTGFNAPQYASGLHMTASAVQQYGQNTGYAFAVASDRPLDLAVLDELGWWATPDLARDFQSMSPRLFAHRVASLVVQQGAQYSVDAASVRSGTYPPMAMEYTSTSVCRQQDYMLMDPRLARALIRHQLWYGCAVPQWAMRQYLSPAYPDAVDPRRPRRPLPVDTADTSALLRDQRPLNAQARAHLERRRAASADSAATADRAMTLRAQELRRQILEIERQRSETLRMTRATQPATPGARPYPVAPPQRSTTAQTAPASPPPASADEAGSQPETRRAAPPARSAEPAPSRTVRRSPPPAPARTAPKPEAQRAPREEPTVGRRVPASPQQ